MLVQNVLRVQTDNDYIRVLRDDEDNFLVTAVVV